MLNIIDAAESLKEKINGSLTSDEPWKDIGGEEISWSTDAKCGVRAERGYYFDFDLPGTGTRCVVIPDVETFRAGDRDTDNNDIVIQVGLIHRPSSRDIRCVDPWAKEALKLREFCRANEPDGFDFYDWDYPDGEVVDSELLRSGIFASIVAFTYRSCEIN